MGATECAEAEREVKIMLLQEEFSPQSSGEKATRGFSLLYRIRTSCRYNKPFRTCLLDGRVCTRAAEQRRGDEKEGRCDELRACGRRAVRTSLARLLGGPSLSLITPREMRPLYARFARTLALGIILVPVCYWY